MKIKKEYIILAVIIILSILYLVLHKTDRAQYQLPEIPKIASKDISKLEINRLDESILLNKKDNKWYIAPEGYPADNQTIKNMLDVIDDLTLTALVSETKSFVRYDLNKDKKITVKAWTGNTMQREFEIGKAAPTYQHTFVHFINDPNIYHARGNFRNKFETTGDKLRDKTVLSFDKKQAQGILMAKGTESEEFIYRLAPVEEGKGQVDDAGDSKTPETKLEWQTAEGKKVEKTEIDGLLSLFADLKCESYIDNKTKEDFKDPTYNLELKGTKDVSLAIFDKLDKEAADYPAISSENDYPFFLSESTGKNIMEKVDKLLKP
jgi:hypothetical protein